MKILRRLAFAFVIAGSSCALADEAQPVAQLSLASFADLYRLTVNAAPEALAFASATPQMPAQVRVAAMQDAFAVAEPRFTIAQVPATRGWMLLLAGLAAASWVAHRRLTSAY
jgi:acetyl-CoA acetyltransferase